MDHLLDLLTIGEPLDRVIIRYAFEARLLLHHVLLALFTPVSRLRELLVSTFIIHCGIAVKI